MHQALSDLLDKRALDELVYRTIHAMDGRDWATYRSGLMDDAVFDFTDHGVATDDAAGIINGADHFIPILSSVLEGFDATQHHLTNMMHRLDSDTARTDCYVYAEHFLNNDRGDRSVTCGGRYEITSRRTESGWKLATLRFVTSWFRGNTSLYKLAFDVAARRQAK